MVQLLASYKEIERVIKSVVKRAAKVKCMNDMSVKCVHRNVKSPPIALEVKREVGNEWM